MIEAKISNKKNPRLAVNTPLYKMIAILLILKHCHDNTKNDKQQGITMGLLQIYLWGLISKTNLKKLVGLKQRKIIDSLPFYYDDSLQTILSCSVINGFIETKAKSQKIEYDLTLKAYVFLSEITAESIVTDINMQLSQLGLLPKNITENLTINWNHVSI